MTDPIVSHILMVQVTSILEAAMGHPRNLLNRQPLTREDLAFIKGVFDTIRAEGVCQRYGQPR